MFITMLGDGTAFAGLVFGYYFYWTIRDDFPPDPAAGPGWEWPSIALGLLLAAWAATLLARRWNGRGRRGLFYIALAAAVLLDLAGAGALAAGPWLTGLDPTAHVYPAAVWIIVVWTNIHVGVGLVMHLYCVARALGGKLTQRYDIDIQNVALYWHFVAATALVGVATIGGFPLVA
jgi:cytochrome c oxidase subunit I+III